MYAGYQFSDSIRLNSEIELEHSKSTVGYVLLEQFNIGIDLSETTTAILGRSLAPMGIVGPRHEPPLFLVLNVQMLKNTSFHLHGQLMVLV